MTFGTRPKRLVEEGQRGQDMGAVFKMVDSRSVDIFTFSCIISYSKPNCWFSASLRNSESLASWQDTGNSASRKQHGMKPQHHDASSGAILNLDHMDYPFHFSFLTLQMPSRSSLCSTWADIRACYRWFEFNN